MSAAAPRSFEFRQKQKHKRLCDEAGALQDTAKHHEAVVLLRENLENSKRILGIEHPITLVDQESLSYSLHELGHFEEAAALDGETLLVRKRFHGLDAADTLETQHNLAYNLSKLGQYEKAIKLNRETLAAREVTLGHNDEDTLSTRHNLASDLHNRGQYEEALNLNRAVLSIREKNLEADNYDLIACRHNLATNLYACGDHINSMVLTQQNLLTLQGARPKHDSQLEAVTEFQMQIQCGIEQTAQTIRAMERKKRKSDEAAKKKQAEEIEKVRLDYIQGKEAHKVKELEKLEKLRAAEDTRHEHANEVQKRKLEDMKRNNQAEEVAVKNIAREKQRKEADEREKYIASEAKTQDGKQRTPDKLDALVTATERASQRKKEVHSQEARCRDEAKNGVQSQIEQQDNSRAQFSTKDGKHMSSPVIEIRGIRGSQPMKKASPRLEHNPCETNGTTGKLGTQAESFLSPSGHGRKHRAKSYENIPRGDPGDTGLKVPHEPKPRAKSVERAPNGQIQGREDSMRNSSSNVPAEDSLSTRRLPVTDKAIPLHFKLGSGSTDKGNSDSVLANSLAVDLESSADPFGSRARIYSNLFDSHDGGRDAATDIQATKSWFTQFDTKTQALLAMGRKPLGPRVKIAIIDTGIDMAHPDFNMIDDSCPENGLPRDRVKRCRSFVAKEKADQDVCGHGTHSAALLLKLAPKANIYVARVVKDETCWIMPETVAEAIMHAVDIWKVDIITMSFGWPQYYRCIENAIDHASLQEVIVCAAASNNGANKEVAFPANYRNVICVHSANGWGKPSDFTPLPLTMFPNFTVIGEAVSSTWPVGRGEGNQKRKWGTSTATPIAAAIAALVLEFVNQKPVKTPHDRRLKKPQGMMQILLAMSPPPERGYHCVMPWRLLDSTVGRTRVESRISDTMDRLFGQECIGSYAVT